MSGVSGVQHGHQTHPREGTVWRGGHVRSGGRGGWDRAGRGRRHEPLCLPSLERESRLLPAHWAHRLSHMVPPKPRAWGVTVLSRFRSRCELGYLVGGAHSRWALRRYDVSTNAFPDKSAQPNDAELARRSGPRTVPSSYSPSSRRGWR